VTGALKEAQLEELKVDLSDLEVSMQTLLDNTEDGTKPVKLKDNIGRLSRMDEMHNQSILVANRNVIKNRLIEVKRARQRIKDDTYGYCTECDEAVAFPRLKAYPEAPMCLDCQRKSESSD
jgi:DnaK suppressor protein